MTTKLARIERLDSKLIRVDVEVSKQANVRAQDERERVELTIHSKGPAIRAEASADDRFAALDIALGKLEGRLRRIADRRKVHHGNHCPPSVAELTSVLGDSYTPLPEPIPAETDRFAEPEEERRRSSDEPAEPIVPIEMDGDGPLVVREKFHKADPMTIDQALLEMELVGHDFYLFRDKESGHPSVVYRRVGYAYGVLRLDEP
ncbi:ribosomal subunit interface protein [Sphaerisporangium rubeum]|uniref:Ribosomal subunit interface protein n=1 Tax=Sphaerisporangium rubeum TaxID=321317 RepID=A0A7X0IDN8_9ACTN|nr:ribosomal subunit interface protein [Sphaerisporangium rubeum]